MQSLCFILIPLPRRGGRPPIRPPSERNAMIRFTPRGAADLSPLGSFPGWFSALLRLRGIGTEEDARRFLSPSLADLHDPFLLSGMDRAVRLIRDVN